MIDMLQNAPDDTLTLVLRVFGAVAYALLLVPSWRSIWVATTPGSKRNRIALTSLLAGALYVQVLATWTRIVSLSAGSSGGFDWVPLSAAVASDLPVFFCLWAFWPWRKE